MVINDEAHHCYREKGDDLTSLSNHPSDQSIRGGFSPDELRGEEKAEAEENNEAARVWISGLETIKRKLGLSAVVDLSATPFFLRGSGYAEGTLFPWTVSDFSLMDAIECGIVKLPRVPVADNIPGGDMPKYRRLWEFIGPKMPKKGRGKAAALDPLALPPELLTALDALYGHYQKTFELWQEAKIDVPPCFIIVCNNTSTSKLVYDYISGFYRENPRSFENGRLPLFRNFDEDGRPLGRPRTLLIDSRQLESGDALDDTFRALAADEIERFKNEIIARTGNREAAENLSDQDLLREVMNTVGKSGRLGESIRCVVSVAMLTEGWDANTVTHVLGIRAFGTQLLCEQVIGRALRRQSYELNERNLFNVEYADVLGIPFDFTARPVVAPPQKPRAAINVHAVSPERDALEIIFPRIAGYRTELPEERLRAVFTEDSILRLDPSLVGPTITRNAGIIGQEVDLTIDQLEKVRPATLLYHLTKRLVETKFRDPSEAVKLPLFGQLKNITRDWLDQCLHCTGGAYPAQPGACQFSLMRRNLLSPRYAAYIRKNTLNISRVLLGVYQELADMACERIVHAVSQSFIGERPVKALFDPYNPRGSSIHVNFTTGKASRWQTDSRKCHVNWVVLDSDWEAEFCRVAESHLQVIAYVKNQGLGFEIPYRPGSQNHNYLPDFIVLINDGSGPADPLHLIVETKNPGSSSWVLRSAKYGLYAGFISIYTLLITNYIAPFTLCGNRGKPEASADQRSDVCRHEPRLRIKGIHGEDAWYPTDTLDKRATIENYWLPGVNRLAAYGRWAFLELRDPFTIESEFKAWIAARTKA
jgi:type III restriction enzyme